MGGLIAKYCSEFTRLGENFKLGVQVDTALVLSRAASKVDMIRAFTVLNTHLGRCVLIICIQDMINYWRS
jgi:hypothetical protein